jgi:hypothetical protein
LAFILQDKTPASPNDMDDLDALLKQFEQPTKSNIKENTNAQQQKSIKPSGGFLSDNPQQPPPSKFPLPSLSKYDTDNRKGNIPLFSEQRRTSNLKQPPKPSIDQSFDIDTILQGRSILPQQPPQKLFHPMAPAKNSVPSPRKDSGISDWLTDDYVTTKTNTQKVTTNVSGKPAIGLNPDDFFFNTNNNRDQNENRAPFSTTKTSAKQYYLGNSRYKPGKIFLFFFQIILTFLLIIEVLIQNKQYVVIVLIGFRNLQTIVIQRVYILPRIF